MAGSAGSKYQLQKGGHQETLSQEAPNPKKLDNLSSVEKEKRQGNGNDS